MSSILVVEDEARISTFVEKGLTAAGYTVTVVTDGRVGLDYASTGSFDLVLLDVGLPGIDGFEVLRQVRAGGSTVPIIMLTARTSVDDTVSGLDGGANDYLPKPFKFDELLARIRVRLREAGQQGADETVLRHGDLALDLRARRITVGGETLDLSAREFGLAEQLLRHPTQVLSREQLLSRVWGFDFDPGSNVVDVYVRYLRAKIGADRIETVRGMGYRMSGESGESGESGDAGLTLTAGATGCGTGAGALSAAGGEAGVSATETGAGADTAAALARDSEVTVDADRPSTSSRVIVVIGGTLD